jgi:hypothetical protein
MMAILLIWTPSAEDGRRRERGVLGSSIQKTRAERPDAAMMVT